MPHDFFLSYACLNNKPAIPNQAASEWVTTFREVLVGRLESFLGRPADVFFDRNDLSGNSALTTEIEAALDDSHLFVAISSPAYYDRSWCKLERERFIQRLGTRPGEAKRVFVIHMVDVDKLVGRDTWQAAFFPDLRGYFFFQEQDGKTLGHPILDPTVTDMKRYYLEIERLASDMATQIKKLEGKSGGGTGMGSAGGAAQPPTAATEAVFLAENAFRSRPEREELRVALRDAGFEVRPEASLAGKPAAELAAAMQGALAFVQIVSPVLREIAGDETTTYDHAQLAAAVACGLPRFRWRALDLDIAAGAKSFPDYETFAKAPDVREQLLPAFKADVIAALNDLRATRRVKQVAQAAQADDRMVLIVGEPDDIAAHRAAVTQQLRAHALGYFIGDEPEKEVQAEDVRGLLVFYGKSSPKWVRDRLTLVRTLPKTRQRDLRVGIYFCEPPPDLDGRPLLFEMPSFRQIFWNDTSSLEAFAKAVAQ